MRMEIDESSGEKVE